MVDSPPAKYTENGLPVIFICLVDSDGNPTIGNFVMGPVTIGQGADVVQGRTDDTAGDNTVMGQLKALVESGLNGSVTVTNFPNSQIVTGGSGAVLALDSTLKLLTNLISGGKLPVSVTDSGGITAVATAAAPTYSENSEEPLSVDLSGGLRITAAALPLPAGAATEATLADLVEMFATSPSLAATVQDVVTHTQLNSALTLLGGIKTGTDSVANGTNLINVNGSAVTSGAGVVTNGTQRITHASNDPVVTSLASQAAAFQTCPTPIGMPGFVLQTRGPVTQRIAIAGAAGAVTVNFAEPSPFLYNDLHRLVITKAGAGTLQVIDGGANVLLEFVLTGTELAGTVIPLEMTIGFGGAGSPATLHSSAAATFAVTAIYSPVGKP